MHLPRRDATTTPASRNGWCSWPPRDAAFTSGGALASLGKVGRVHVEGRDIDVPASPWGTLFETGIRAAIRQPLGSRAYLEAHAEGLVKLATWTVYLDRAAIWSTPRLTETIGLDFGVLFP